MTPYMQKFRAPDGNEVEAHLWERNGDHPEDNRDVFDAGKGPFLGEGKVVRYYRTPELDGQNECQYCGRTMHDHGWIDAGEDGLIVCPGDWIVTDPPGNYYPCKPSVFAYTFELIPQQ